MIQTPQNDRNYFKTSLQKSIYFLFFVFLFPSRAPLEFSSLIRVDASALFFFFLIISDMLDVSLSSFTARIQLNELS